MNSITVDTRNLESNNLLSARVSIHMEQALFCKEFDKSIVTKMRTYESYLSLALLEKQNEC